MFRADCGCSRVDNQLELYVLAAQDILLYAHQSDVFDEQIPKAQGQCNQRLKIKNWTESTTQQQQSTG